MSMHHKIINGDRRKTDVLPIRSVHLIMTSAPYCQLKGYGSDNQIGLHDSVVSYINNN